MPRRLGASSIDWDATVATTYDLILSASDHDDVSELQGPIVVPRRRAGFENQLKFDPGLPQVAAKPVPPGEPRRVDVAQSASVRSRRLRSRPRGSSPPDTVPGMSANWSAIVAKRRPANDQVIDETLEDYAVATNSLVVHCTPTSRNARGDRDD